MKSTAFALLAASAVTLSLTAPVHAAPIERADWPGYILTVEFVRTGEIRGLNLHCDPAGGSHPKPEEACSAIAGAGSIEELRGEPAPCTLVHDPVIARATGVEEFEQEFPNSCVLLNEKGVVFDF